MACFLCPDNQRFFICIPDVSGYIQDVHRRGHIYLPEQMSYRQLFPCTKTRRGEKKKKRKKHAFLKSLFMRGIMEPENFCATPQQLQQGFGMIIESTNLLLQSSQAAVHTEGGKNLCSQALTDVVLQIVRMLLMALLKT